MTSVNAGRPGRSYCPSRIFGGARVLCFVKRIHRSRSAASIGKPVDFGRGGGWPDAPVARQPRVTLRFPYNGTRQLPARPVFTLPDVRTDDAVRRLAAVQPLAQGPAVAPTDSPACPFPATGASESR